MNELPTVLRDLSFDGVTRIDVGLEGDWSTTAVTVWSREEGLLGFSEVIRSHPTFKPGLELYFGDSWFGIHCYRRLEGKNVFDDELARRVIDHVESRVRHTT